MLRNDHIFEGAIWSNAKKSLQAALSVAGWAVVPDHRASKSRRGLTSHADDMTERVQVTNILEKGMT